MKHITILVITLMLLCPPAIAADNITICNGPPCYTESRWFTPLRTQDMVMEGAWFALHSIDFAQTQDIVRNPHRFHENNPILGKHPTKGAVNVFFLSSVIVHGIAVWAMPREYRVWFQGISIGVKAVVVGSNHHIGLQAAWPF